MKTLIELYDESPIENVLSSEVFQPERTVFLCPENVAANQSIQRKLRAYFKARGLTTEPVFLASHFFSSEDMSAQLQQVVEQYPDCALDISGGTDAALFASGSFCVGREIPVFTYSRKRSCFFNIHNAPFADELPCTVQHNVADCFLMAGGALREGRVDNRILSDYLDVLDPFMDLFLRHRMDWVRTVNYMQRASQGEPSVQVRAPMVVKGERGTRLQAPLPVLEDLEALGFLQELKMEGEELSFRFRDLQIRAWLRDIGSVLELYVYKACLDAGVFQDVRTSAVVDWERDVRHDSVTNEIDVMAMRGIVPLFISCKTCDVTTEALNELAILRDRFGGKTAKAAIVTAQRCRNVTRHRAAALDIDVIDLEDLRLGRIADQLKAIMSQN